MIKKNFLLSSESETYFVISDNIGNISSVIDNQGNTVNKYAYSPFGELIIEEEGVDLNIGFNTKYEDESGLTYYNNRYYDSELGRFISQDPIFEEGGVNLYSFVENDPVNHWDILGFTTGTYRNISVIRIGNTSPTFRWEIRLDSYCDCTNDNVQNPILVDSNISYGVYTSESVANNIATNLFSGGFVCSL